MGLFSNIQVYLGFRGLGDDDTFLSHVILQDGRLGMIPREDEYLAEAKLKPIRILAKVDKVWVLSAYTKRRI